MKYGKKKLNKLDYETILCGMAHDHDDVDRVKIRHKIEDVLYQVNHELTPLTDEQINRMDLSRGVVITKNKHCQSFIWTLKFTLPLINSFNSV